jgi:hypothetical protein
MYLIYFVGCLHRCASIHILMAAISDIDLCYSDIDIRVHSDIKTSFTLFGPESNPCPLVLQASLLLLSL